MHFNGMYTGLKVVLVIWDKRWYATVVKVSDFRSDLKIDNQELISW